VVVVNLVEGTTFWIVALTGDGHSEG